MEETQIDVNRMAYKTTEKSVFRQLETGFSVGSGLVASGSIS